MKNIFIPIILFSIAGCSVEWADKLAEKGYSNEGINRYKKAIRCYNRAILFNKKSSLAYWRRAAWYYKNDDYNKSINDLSIGIELDSSFNNGHFFSDRGDSEFMLGNFESAIRDYTTAIGFCKIEPNLPSTPKENYFYDRARAYLNVSDTISALKDLDSAIYYWDKFPRALWLRAQTKSKLGRFGDAIQDYKTLPLDEREAEFDYNAENFYYQGLAKFRTGDSTYCYDWKVASSYKFRKAILAIERYCKN